MLHDFMPDKDSRNELNVHLRVPSFRSSHLWFLGSTYMQMNCINQYTQCFNSIRKRLNIILVKFLCDQDGRVKFQSDFNKLQFWPIFDFFCKGSRDYSDELTIGNTHPALPFGTESSRKAPERQFRYLRVFFFAFQSVKNGRDDNYREEVFDLRCDQF